MGNSLVDLIYPVYTIAPNIAISFIFSFSVVIMISHNGICLAVMCAAHTQIHANYRFMLTNAQHAIKTHRYCANRKQGRHPKDGEVAVAVLRVTKVTPRRPRIRR